LDGNAIYRLIVDQLVNNTRNYALQPEFFTSLQNTFSTKWRKIIVQILRHVNANF